MEYHQNSKFGTSASIQGAYTNTLSDIKKSTIKILERKAENEKIRKQLKTLSDYEFVFGIPKKLKSHIENERTDLIVSEYRNACILFNSTQEKIFKKVQEEVDMIIQKYTETKLKSLEDFNQKSDEQIEAIKTLFRLSSKTDPIFHFLNSGYIQIQHAFKNEKKVCLNSEKLIRRLSRILINVLTKMWTVLRKDAVGEFEDVKRSSKC